MAITPDIQATQSGVFSVFRATTPDLTAFQAQLMTVYNIPSKHMQASNALVMISFRQPSKIKATSAAIMAVVSGRIANPNIRVFTVTLDGHDFYVIRLGDTETLVYDVYSQQWIEWTSNSLPFWRANTGCNWIGAQALALQYGSDIVIGDDVYGLLYFLNPEQPYDDHPDFLNPQQQLEFDRIIMAQTTVPGRQFQPCYAIFLDGDNYGISATDFSPFIRLETSDDQGRTWLNHGDITIQPDTMDQDYRWYSLGQMQSPGRLFRITDNGILTRIDSLEMNDD